MDGLIIDGGGRIDGGGSDWWNSCKVSFTLIVFLQNWDIRSILGVLLC